MTGPERSFDELREMTRHTMVEFNQMKAFYEDPLIVVEGEGIHLTDARGRRFIDGLSGVFAVSVGHGNREVIGAIAEQHSRVAFSSPIMTTTPPALELAARLVDLSRGRAAVIKQYTSGSESTEAAIKIARQFHHQSGAAGRFKIVSLYRAYHGSTMGALTATGQPVLQTPFHPLAGGFIHVPPPIPGWDGQVDETPAELAARSLALLRATLEAEGPETIAAIMLEPIMLTAGVHMPPPQYLRGLRELCDEIGALLIFDEIVTGFGRVGEWFAADLGEVWPDLLCVGKGISGGYAPTSAVLMPDEIAAAFWAEPEENRQYQSGHTFASNPISAAACLAVIDYIERNDLLAHVRSAGAAFGERLRSIAAASPLVREVRGVGFMWGIELAPPDGSDIALGSALQRVARENGVLIRASRQVVQIAPPLIATAAELEEIGSILEASVAELEHLVESGQAAAITPSFSL